MNPVNPTNPREVAARTLSDYFRIPPQLLGCIEFDEATGESGFFRFGSDVCYGHCRTGYTSRSPSANAYDACKDLCVEGTTVHLPFDPVQVIDNLLGERYTARSFNRRNGTFTNALGRIVYYRVRNLLPDSIRRSVQRAYLGDWQQLPFPAWPMDTTVDRLREHFLCLSMHASGVQRVPFVWFWPNAARNCLIMTHDVETLAGRNFTSSLMDLDESYGLKASFQVVPESRYEIPDDFVDEIRHRGFELNIHDLNHDGFLFANRQEFLRRATKINLYARKYEARGFRAAVMYRKQEWYDAFKFSYDMSIPSVSHLEPQRGGCCTVMPYFIGQILELPLTLTQDYSVFHILRTYSIDLWKQQLSLLRKRHGLISFIVHPDYIIESRARSTYEALLDHLRDFILRERVWATLPREVDKWWRARAQMNIVRNRDGWEIDGPEKEQARLAYAVLKDGHITYELD